MAKRTTASATCGSTSVAPPAMEMSICCSFEEDRQPFLGTEEQVRLSSEEAPQADSTTFPAATAASPQPALVEWTYVCPLCCSAKLVNPVEVHASSTDDRGGKGHCQQRCFACRACAERWHAAMSVLEETQSYNADACEGGSRTSLASPSLTCPLCDCAMPSGPTPNMVPLGADAPHPETVRNGFTGLLPAADSHNASANPSQKTPSAPSAFYCGVCEEQKATCVCVQCDFGLCDACHQATHTKGKFKLHEVVGLDQARRRDHLKCQEHHGMALDLYCETCATCVCVTCCFGGAHRGHEVFPLSDVAHRTAEVLKKEAHELSVVGLKASTARAELAGLGPQYDVKVKAVENDIRRCFSSLRRILQEREDALLGQLHSTSADVRQRSSKLQSATDALTEVLHSASARLANVQATVSPATLMRVAPQLLEHQAWAQRLASRLTEEATATAEGWTYQLGEEGMNGCRMACFDMLNAQTLNEKGIVQYQQVLADLGRLEVSAELQPPTVRSSAMDSEAGRETAVCVEEVEEEDEEEEAVQERGGANGEKSVVGPIVELTPESPTLSPGHHRERSDFSSVKSHEEATKPQKVMRRLADTAEDDAPQLRPSHMSEAPSSFTASEPPTANRATEMHLTSGNSSGAAGFSRVAGLRSATSSSTRLSVPRSLVIGGSRDESSFALSAVSRTTPATSQVRAALDALGRRETESHASVPSSASSFTSSVAHAQLARDTMPFRVSMPQKRVWSLDRGDDALRSDGTDTGSSSWRALKLHRAGTVQDTAYGELATRTSSRPPSPYPGSSWQPGGSARLSFFSEFEVCKPSKSNGVSPVRGLNGETAAEEPRGTIKRKTTGLQLEL